MVAKKTGLSRERRKPPPLDQHRLEELALAYVARFATTRGKLLAYLDRKIRQRGVVEDAAEIDPQAVADRLVELRYIDEAGYARARSQGLLRKGYGARRVAQALHAAGIDAEMREQLAPGEAETRQAALALARKRRFGPFGALTRGDPLDRALREKQVAAMVRAGHGFDVAIALIDSPGIAEAEEWAREAEDDRNEA